MCISVVEVWKTGSYSYQNAEGERHIVRARKNKMPPKPIDMYKRPFYKPTLEKHEIQV